MKIRYGKAFSKDLEAISNNPGMKKRLLELIEKLKITGSLNELHGVRKIEGYESYYRVRISDYRLGAKVSGDFLELIRFLHRKEIYRRFP
jgi:mRNA interferase RelE/StbE